MMNADPMPHSAIVKVTGWPDISEQGVIIGGLAIKTPWRPDETPQRITVTAYPRTDQHGMIRQLLADPKQVRPAKRPNGTQWRVVGHLLQVCRSTGRIKIEVIPQTMRIPLFVIHAYATSAVLHDPRFPEAVHVEASGIVLAGRVLLTETMRPVRSDRSSG